MKRIVLFLIVLFSINHLYAQYNFTDIHPDSKYSIHPSNSGNSFTIDIDGDQISDLQFYWWKATLRSCSVTTINQDFKLAGSNSYAACLNYLDNLNHFGNWVSGTITMADSLYSGTSGPWLNDPVKKFLGFIKITGTDTLYGWIRITLSGNYSEITIHDYCMATQPGGISYAGQGLENDPKNVVLKDIGDEMNGNDLSVSFTSSVNESLVSEYRIMVVPSALAPSFGLTQAVAVPAGSYMSIIPGGHDTTVQYGTILTDVTFSLVTGTIPYQAFVMAIPDGVISTDTLLSLASASLTLKSCPETFSHLMVADAGDQNNSSDMNLCAQLPGSLHGISQIRVFMVKNTQAHLFDLNTALSIPQGNYVSTDTSAITPCITFAAGLPDSNGDLITDHVCYRAFILCLPDTIFTDSPSLSAPSSPFILSTPGAFITGQFSGIDVHYTDIEPDTVLTSYPWLSSLSYYIDFDHDNVFDINITSHYNFSMGGSSQGIFSIGYNNNECIRPDSLSELASILSEGEMLFDERIWKNDDAKMYILNELTDPYQFSYDGLWSNPNDTQFLALRFFTGNDTNYAWVRMRVTSPSSVTILDYAFIGHDYLSADDENMKIYSFYPNPVNEYIFINGELNKEKNLTYKVSDLTGKRVASGTVSENGMVPVGTLPAGIYMLTITASENQITHTFVKTDSIF